ncbi:tRNA (guanosine(46)-N7)-methyltransferase TrmB [Candidatus Parcubacteria bacterium]|nr:MAG: tRNA (guanosine(46)-N7)-methyltransferase TrmB [Candidatus Parcubacteria bacterium]
MQQPASAIITPDSWTETLSIDSLFPVKGRLEVEIGCGKGKFLLSRAASCPGSNFLGIDKMMKRLRKTDRKIAKSGLQNVKLVHIEASYVFEKLLPDSSVWTLYIFFPDPWPKRRHHLRRLFTPQFMDSQYRVLIPGAQIYIATDHLEYSKWISKLFSNDPRYISIPPLEPTEEERSEFDTLFMSQGTAIARLGFSKK